MTAGVDPGKGTVYETGAEGGERWGAVKPHAMHNAFVLFEESSEFQLRKQARHPFGGLFRRVLSWILNHRVRGWNTWALGCLKPERPLIFKSFRFSLLLEDLQSPFLAAIQVR
jgi:hypothetical protein